MTSIDSSTGAYVSVDDLAVESRRRGAVGDAEPAGQPQLADRADARTASADALDQAATDTRVKVVRLAGAGRGFSSGAGIGAEDQAKKARRADRARRGQPRRARDRRAAPARGLRRAGTRRGRRRVAGVGVRRRTRLGEGYFMLAFTKIGLMPDGGASALVAAAVGRIRAMRMALLAERSPPPRRFDAGLVSAVYPADELDAEVDKVIATLVSRPGGGVAQDQGRHQRGDADRTRGRARAGDTRARWRCCGAPTSARASRPSSSVGAAELHRLREDECRRAARKSVDAAVVPISDHRMREYAIRDSEAGGRRRPMARARTLPRLASTAC